MITDPLVVPVLNGLVPQGAVVDPPQPATAAANQHPVRTTLVFIALESKLTEPSQRLIRLQHPEAATGSLADPQLLEHLLEHEHLGLAAVGPEPEPADEHQHQTVEPAALEQQHSTEKNHQGGESAS